jgi:hypothetical protein
VTGRGNEDGKLIQKYLYKLRNDLVKYFHDGSLESSWCHLQPKHHDHRDINTPIGDEGCFVLIFRGELYLILPAKPI